METKSLCLFPYWRQFYSCLLPVASLCCQVLTRNSLQCQTLNCDSSDEPWFSAAKLLCLVGYAIHISLGVGAIMETKSQCLSPIWLHFYSCRLPHFLVRFLQAFLCSARLGTATALTSRGFQRLCLVGYAIHISLGVGAIMETKTQCLFPF